MYEVYESFILFDLSEQRIGISVEFLKNNMQLSQRHEIKDETTQPRHATKLFNLLVVFRNIISRPHKTIKSTSKSTNQRRNDTMTMNNNSSLILWLREALKY